MDGMGEVVQTWLSAEPGGSNEKKERRGSVRASV